METWLIILLHQLLFQGMFFIKSTSVAKKLGRTVRGTNREANAAIAFIVVYLGVALFIAYSDWGVIDFRPVAPEAAVILGGLFLAFNLLLAAASLVGMKESWRIGIIESDVTPLVTTGIYRLSRHPYFLSYLIMFVAYTVMLQSLVMLLLSCLGAAFIHAMVLREEDYLLGTHGNRYRRYMLKVPRYLSLV